MDIRNARTFLEVVKTGSFMNAAANLHLTQTAVSARIRTLEQALDRPLFVRNKSGARLTPAGAQFLRYATTLVQMWERARYQVSLPPGRQTVVSVGGEMSLWDPLLVRWLAWMRAECPDVAIRTTVDSGDRLVEQVQDGLIDVALVYSPRQRPGLVTELLAEEKLVLVTTRSGAEELSFDDYIFVDWGPDFSASHDAAFADKVSPALVINYGPLALEHMLAHGGSGYFRFEAVRRHIEEGRLHLAAEKPKFAYSAHAVYLSEAESPVIERVKMGLRLSAAAR